MISMLILPLYVTVINTKLQLTEIHHAQIVFTYGLDSCSNKEEASSNMICFDWQTK